MCNTPGSALQGAAVALERSHADVLACQGALRRHIPGYLPATGLPIGTGDDHAIIVTPLMLGALVQNCRVRGLISLMTDAVSLHSPLRQLNFFVRGGAGLGEPAQCWQHLLVRQGLHQGKFCKALEGTFNKQGAFQHAAVLPACCARDVDTASLYQISELPSCVQALPAYIKHTTLRL